MQIRELGACELDEAYALLCTLRLDLDSDSFKAFLNATSSHSYRALGVFDQEGLSVYAGVSVHQNFELGRYMLIDDFVASQNAKTAPGEMIAYIEDYAKFHGCKTIVLWGKQRGVKLEDLKGFRPKRDGYIKTL